MSLKRLLCTTIPPVGQSAPLSEEETLHTLHVLRLQVGDTVLVIDGCGVEASAKLEVKAKKAFIKIEAHTRKEPKPATVLALKQAIIKADAMSLVVEKATELGCTDFYPLFTEYVAVRFKDREPAEIQNRWQRISDQALKQSGRLWKMTVHAPEKLSNSLTTASPSGLYLWADETQHSDSLLATALFKKPKANPIEIAIGPEGGWGPADRALFLALLKSETAGPWQAVGLGPHILRAETAAICALSLCQSALLMR